MADKRPGYDAVITAEYRLLNALIKNSSYFNDSRVTENILTDETAKSIFQAIRNLSEKNIRITPASLYQAGTEIDFNVSRSIINTIFDIDKEGATSLDDIIPVLTEAKSKFDILSIINNIKQSLQSPGNLDIGNLQSNLFEIDNILNNKSIESPLITFDEWADLYEKELDLRAEGKKYSYGDVFLDETLFMGAAPGLITTVAGATGSGKSFYVLNLINNLIDQNAPCMYISLEMGDITTFDRLMALRCGIPNEDLYKKENIEGIRESLSKQREELKNNKNFFFSQEPEIDLVKLRAMIKEYKQRTKNDYVFVVIDLLTMVKEFSKANGNMAQSIEVAMNQLHAIAKAEKVHILGVVQFGRNADNTKIHSIEELDNLRPSLNDIKNANAIAERSRVVLGLFHPKNYVDKYLVTINAPGSDDFEDTIEVQILKNSQGSVGKVFKYMAIPEQFKLIPIEEEDIMKKLESSIDNFI